MPEIFVSELQRQLENARTLRDWAASDGDEQLALACDGRIADLVDLAARNDVTVTASAARLPLARTAQP